MCHWSWFLNECSCVSSPCDTALCFPHDEDDDFNTCICSMLICNMKQPEMEGACNITQTGKFLHSDGRPLPECICLKSFRYGRATVEEERPRGPPPKDFPGNNETFDGMGGPPSILSCASRPKDQSEKCTLYRALVSAGMTKQSAGLIANIKASMVDDLKDIERLFKPSLETTIDFGNDLDTLVLSCSFGHTQCDKKDFKTLFSPTYGKCFMFNYIGSDNDNEPKIIRHGGRNNGLQLYLQARPQDSIDLLNSQHGVRIVVHDPYRLPFASEFGIDIRPGDMSNLDIQYSKLIRAGPPHGECLTDGSSLPYYKEKQYDQLLCERQCLNDLVSKRCKCYHRQFTSATLIPKPEGKPCDTVANKDEDRCFMKILRMREEGQALCQCLPSCQEKIYTSSLSSGRLNQEFFRLVRSVKALKIVDGVPHIPNISSKFDMMGLRIYYKTMSMTTTTETPAYSWQSLVANVGGNMGLFLGMSLVTFLEIFEFLMDSLCSLFMPTKVKKVRKTVIKVRPKKNWKMSSSAFY